MAETAQRAWFTTARPPKAGRLHIGGESMGPNGLMRFVTGIYSDNQPVALMVGMLLDPHKKIVPPLIEALENKKAVDELRMIKDATGKVCRSPSSLFAPAEFDTTHERPSELAPSHGIIQVAHLFLQFHCSTAS